MKAARLKERNPSKGLKMRTYTTAATGTKYTAGDIGRPSPLRIVKEPSELEELSGIPQFEVLEFGRMSELDDIIQNEMEARARIGNPAVRAEVLAEKGAKAAAESEPVKTGRKLDDVIPRSDPDKTEEPAETPQEDSKEGDADKAEDNEEETGSDDDDLAEEPKDDEPEAPAEEPKDDEKTKPVPTSKSSGKKGPGRGKGKGKGKKKN